MRAAPTRAEALLWQALRRRALGGRKFRRQQVIAGYIVDFYCAEVCLAVEVDGAVHDAHAVEDRERDAALKGLGVRVVRVSNDDVMERLESVLDALEQTIVSIANKPPLRS
jgi:very-short-patch-repair endonuclease